MTIEEYFGEWSRVIDLQETDRIMRRLTASNESICPVIGDIFKAFRLCSLSNLRMVIMGQDPYPNIINNKPVATGIAFANSSDTQEEDLSPSLNILMDSVINFSVPHGIVNFDPSLEKWEEQGVLLLNAALSCIQGKPGSHMLLWRPFMKSLLSRLSMQVPGIIYMLMGQAAQGLECFINQKFNTVFKVRHPSYYARTGGKMPSEIWKVINNILVSQEEKGIEWYEEYQLN